MIEILEIPEVRARVSKLSVKEYHQLGEFNENGRRTELIRGIVIEKTSKSPLHYSIAMHLQEQLQVRLKGDWKIRFEGPLTFADSEPEPDIAVVPAGNYTHGHPKSAALIVEVAVSSVSLDRANCGLYAEAGVGEYWIVLAKQQMVEVYTGSSEGSFAEKQTYACGETILCASLPGLALPVSSIFEIT